MTTRAPNDETITVASTTAPPVPAADPGPADRPDRSVPIYRGLLLEIERRRLQLGISMEQVNDLAGIQDGYYAKMLYPDTPSGREARFKTIELVIKALFPDGFDLEVRPRKGPLLTAWMQKMRIRQAASISDRKLQRELMKELSAKGASKGGLARAARLKWWERRQIARKAGRARARKAQLARGQAGPTAGKRRR